MNEIPQQNINAGIQMCSRPIFIIGSDRSGTSVLARSLGHHSQLWVSDESDILFDFFGEGRLDKVFNKAIERPTGNLLQKESVSRSEFIQHLGLGINALFTSRSKGKRWIDHTPGYTSMVDVLAEMFPRAQFLHILRDGRRVVNSMINIVGSFTKEQAKAMVEKGYLPSYVDFTAACRRWSTLVETAMEFCAKNPDRSLAVINEKLIGNPEEEFKRIFEFLELPYEAISANYFSSTRAGSSLIPYSKDPTMVRQLSHPWKNWTVDQKLIFLKEAAPTLIKHKLCSREELVLSDYDHTVLQLRQILASTIPHDAKVAVVSKGDPQLLELNGLEALHFPQDEAGEHAGNPENSAEAVLQLEAVCARGTGFLVFPTTSFWWLDYYKEFREYLDSCHQLFLFSEDCIIYDLSNHKQILSPSSHAYPSSALPLETSLVANASRQQSAEKLLDELLAEKPKLHYWSGEWQHGSLGDEALRKLFEITSNATVAEGACALETGAGLSTLVLLAARPRRLISIAPDASLKERIKERIDRLFSTTAEHFYYLDRSENVLPTLARAEHPYLDIALMDGGHGMPTVFVDFSYINSILKQGGHLVLDDLQLHSVRQLYLLLQQQPGFEVAAEFGKTVFIKKTTPERFLPDFGGQPFVISNSKASRLYAAPSRQ